MENEEIKQNYIDCNMGTMLFDDLVKNLRINIENKIRINEAASFNPDASVPEILECLQQNKYYKIVIEVLNKELEKPKFIYVDSRDIVDKKLKELLEIIYPSNQNRGRPEYHIKVNNIIRALEESLIEAYYYGYMSSKNNSNKE